MEASVVFSLVVGAIFLAILTAQILSVIDILKHRFPPGKRHMWFMLVLFVPFFGTVAYIFIGRKQKISSVE